MGESFVVVPTSELDEFIERRNSKWMHAADAASRKHLAGNPASSRDTAGAGSVPGAAGSRLRVPPLGEVCRVEQIMALASGQAETDHPVCSDCLGQVLKEVQRQIDQASDEHRVYSEAHSRLQEELGNLGVEDASVLEADIARLEAEERQLLTELQGFDREEEELVRELERHKQRDEKLRKEEADFWLSVAEYQLDLEETEGERAATASAIQYATAELNRLKRANVLNDMFHISQEGPFGTINNFRMGRLPDQQVPWEEINAAWGQACLLLDALMRKCGMPMTTYRLLPRGNYSEIQAGGDTLKLHYVSSGLSHFFSGRRFDQAMSAFLSCLKEVTRFLQRQLPSIKIPFKFEEGDKVGGFLVRMQFNQDERWTKALKFMLLDLKWIIGIVESREFISERAACQGAVAAAASAPGGAASAASLRGTPLS